MNGFMNLRSRQILNLNGKSIRLKKMKGEGVYGKIYEAEITNVNPVQKVIVKVFFNKPNALLHYKNEASVLHRFHKLIDRDDERLILVQELIPGKTLGTEIKELEEPREINALKSEYLNSLKEFTRSTGLVHGDPHPDNVIRHQTTGQLEWIDFGLTYQPSEPTRENAINRDQLTAMSSFDKHRQFTLKRKRV